eukprot:CAMPEP_0119329884 /NCGR_PEP_ID=MMETSP1333-20130426/76951_1 /TAXON_ID=418940 /ORGANISM="Scyphosphaera apsteinii, Strain RCC1455" /LENGTH=339 /DNA_ID=CAMNT_0007339119 /DNA_START=98 /DNA_END=1114 /DNA_ORIENTATION=+
MPDGKREMGSIVQEIRRKGVRRSLSQSLSDWDKELAQNESISELPDSRQNTPKLDRVPTTGDLRGKRKMVKRSKSVTLPEEAQSDNSPPTVLEKHSPLKPHRLQFLVSPIAGATAGALEISLLWPMEWAKVQMQLPRTDANYSLLKDIRRTRFGIYKGLPPMLIGVPLQGATRFTVLDRIKQALTEPGEVPGRATNLVAGILAGTLEATLVVTPVETIKTRLVDANKGLVRGTINFYKTEGVAGIYRGLFPTIMKSASNQALRFFIFGEYKRIVMGSLPTSEMPPSQALAGGMVAGAIGSLITMPFDVVKTRMQGLQAKKYSGFINCLLTMGREEGITA